MPATFALLHLAGYIALLLWGMHMVHSGIIRAFGGHLRQALAVGLQSRWKAFLAGLGITALLQSSTATALMSTSFIAAGFITLVPALAVTETRTLMPYDCPATGEPVHVSSLPERPIEHTPGPGWSMILVNVTPRGAMSVRVALGAGVVLEPRISYTNDARPSASRNTVAGADLCRES